MKNLGAKAKGCIPELADNISAHGGECEVKFAVVRSFGRRSGEAMTPAYCLWKPTG